MGWTNQGYKVAVLGTTLTVTLGAVGMFDDNGNLLGTSANPIATTAGVAAQSTLPESVAIASEYLHADAKWGVPSGFYASQTTGGDGVVTAGFGEVTVSSGTSLGGVATLFSDAVARPYNGMFAAADVVGRFSDPPADGLAITLMGPQTATDGMGIAYYLGNPAVFHKVGGKREIQRLTITTGAGGAEDIDITLNGVAFAQFSTGGALSTAALADLVGGKDFSGTGGGFNSQGYTDDGNVYVDFTGFNAADLAGAFTFTSSGTAAATFSEVTAGAVGTDSWILRAAWDDPLDGTGASGLVIDLTDQHEWSWEWNEYVIRYFVTDPDTGRRILYHAIVSEDTPVLINSIMPVQVIAYAAGTTTGQSVHWRAWGASLLGDIPDNAPRRGLSASATAGASPVVVASYRIKDEFAGLAYNAPARLIHLSVSSDDTSRAIRISLVRNGTLTGAEFSRVGTVGVLLEDTSATAITGGVVIDARNTVRGDKAEFSTELLRRLGVELQRGDTLSIVATRLAGSGTPEVDSTASWLEER